MLPRFKGLPLLVWLLVSTVPGLAQSKGTADVVVVVDTSVSMAEPGMDPERTSLLVAKLLADIVPGSLAVVRVLDLTADKDLVPSRNTGKVVDCPESPSGKCNQIEPLTDWYKDARTRRFGALVRPSRADARFKQELDTHLEQNRHNSHFGLAFRAAQGVFDGHPQSQPVTRTLIWLSDGESDDPGQLQLASQELMSQGVEVNPIIFGKGNPALSKKLGLNPKQVRSPAELMKAFAGVFRHVVQAPYELDHLVSAQPAFEVKPKVDEMWVVVYGDDTLGAVTIDSPSGPKAADYAQDQRQKAGAYKALYVEKPQTGKWGVRVIGGGAGVAYAVVQRSSLIPILVEPKSAMAGTSVAVVAGLGPDPSAPLLVRADLPEGLKMQFTFDGRTYEMADDGANGDKVANDGLFTAMVIFPTVGEASAVLRAKSDLLDKSLPLKIPVSGMFKGRGRVRVDLGSIPAGIRKCCPVKLPAEHVGLIQFEFNESRALPSGHLLELHVSRGTLRAGGPKTAIGPEDPLEVCLETERRAPSSRAQGEQWAELAVAGTKDPAARVPFDLKWEVRGLSWWELWGWLVWTILGILIFIGIVLGWIIPRRFPRGLALVFVPEREEVDEQTPQPIAQWKGVGVRWYRDGRAYLQSNFRVNGNARGAVASLHAVAGGAEVHPESMPLFRETSEGEWEPVQAKGRRTGSDIYRIGEQGPYFRVVRRG